MNRVNLLRNGMLAVVFGCFAVSLWTAYLNLSEADGAMRSRLAENAVWAGAQVQNELARFRDAAHELNAAPDLSKAENLRRRFDLFWSRVGILETGDLGVFIASTGLKGAVAEIRHDLDRLDLLVSRLPARSVADLPASILAASAALMPKAQTLAAAIMQTEQERVSGLIDQRDRALSYVSVSLIGLLIFGTGILASLSVSLKRAQTARSQADMSREAALSANDRLTAALEGMSDGFAIIGPDYQFSILNRRFCRLFEAQTDLLRPGDDFGRFAKAFGIDINDDAVAPCEGTQREPFTIALPDGRRVQFQIRPMNGGGRVCVASDVTDREVWLEQTEAARKAAEHSNAAKSRFLAMMSHEIRTPMNGVLGLLEAMLDDPLPPAIRRQLETAMQSAGTLRIVIDDLLDASKIEAGELHLQSHTLNPGRLAAETCDLLRANAREMGTVLVDRVAPDVPRHVSGDPNRIRQILSNLIGNAIKFTPSGTVTVSLNVSIADGRSMLTYEISDTGIGIPEQHHHDLFRPFQQIDGGYARKFGGTGLGLAISKALTEAMGGTIGFTSKPGEGSTFRFSIPLVQTTQAVADTRRFPAVSTASSCRPRVLLVEDSETNRIVARTFLRGADAVVDEAENGQIGVDLARRNDYDLVLMDVAMPVMDGIEATQRIREFSSVPIVGLSAHAFEEEINRCLAAGMDRYLAKPVTKSTLVEAVVAMATTPTDRDERRVAC